MDPDIIDLLARCAQEIQEWIDTAEECDPEANTLASQALLEEIGQALQAAFAV